MGLTLSLMTLISRLAGDSAAVLSLHMYGDYYYYLSFI